MQRLTPRSLHAVLTADNGNQHEVRVSPMAPGRPHLAMRSLSVSASTVLVANVRARNELLATNQTFHSTGLRNHRVSATRCFFVPTSHTQRGRGNSSMNRMASLMMGAVLLLLASAGRLAAQSGSEPSPLVISADNITAKADVAAGKRAATAISAVVPGDVVEYRLVFTNTKKIAVLNILFQDPIPAGLQFVGGSAQSSRSDATVEYSTDRGATWSAQPLMDVVEDGRVVKKPAPPEMYTTVRWRVGGPVAPGATVEARFRTRAITGPSSDKRPAKDSK